MATRAWFTPEQAAFPDTNFPALLKVNGRFVAAFDASTEETMYFTTGVPQGVTGSLTFVLSYMMASATTGGVAFRVGVEAVTSGDALDLDATTSFDTGNVGTDGTVPGTAGHMEQISITLTNADSAAAADYLRLSVTREVGNASDTATGDAYYVLGELRDAA